MKIAIGADHLGYTRKQQLIRWLKENDHDVLDLGTFREERDELICDYADAVCAAVAGGQVERGLLICQSGGFMTIRANKWPSLRSALAFSPECVAHDRAASNINVLSFPGQYQDVDAAIACLEAFLTTEFEPLERRVIRLKRLESSPTA